MAGKQLVEVLEAVSDESSFVRFVELLVADRQSADSLALTVDGFRGDWANQTIADFLEAASAWAKDSAFGDPDGSYTDRFHEFLREARRHPQFRAFHNQPDALAWLAASAIQSGAA